ncbi:MAG: methyltransferase domain-containing protein [Magnetococcales bacterium]|nr:methyltransferase domain-containing protein [Magnetococcales bacterium]
MATPYSYDQGFLSATTSGNLLSARKITARLMPLLQPRSVVDFGCAQGGWLAAWREQGVADVLGLDGAYVRVQDLMIPASGFMPVDLAESIQLARTFDLAMSLEVAEHLPPQASRNFVASLTRHADIVLFSAAPPGQGGEHHINEQPYQYWRDLFASLDYVLLDFCRQSFRDDPEIQPWYRYNIFLFCKREHLSRLPAPLTATLLDPAQPVPDLSPWHYRLRKRIVPALPYFVRQWLAKAMVRLRG